MVWRLAIAAGLVSLFVGADLFVTTWSERGVPRETITVCRATDVPDHPYQAADVQIAADGSLPREVDKARDVVPPYAYGGTDYPGVNWSSQGQAVWYAGCQATGNSVAVSVDAPTPPTATKPESQSTAQPPEATLSRGAIQAIAATVGLIGLVLIGFGAMAASLASDDR